MRAPVAPSMTLITDGPSGFNHWICRRISRPSCRVISSGPPNARGQRWPLSLFSAGNAPGAYSSVAGYWIWYASFPSRKPCAASSWPDPQLSMEKTCDAPRSLLLCSKLDQRAGVSQCATLWLLSERWSWGLSPYSASLKSYIMALGTGGQMLAARYMHPREGMSPTSRENSRRAAAQLHSDGTLPRHSGEGTGVSCFCTNRQRRRCHYCHCSPVSLATKNGAPSVTHTRRLQPRPGTAQPAGAPAYTSPDA